MSRVFKPVLNHIEQSENWAKFQESVKYRGKVWKIGELQMVKHQFPLGFCWFSCDRGKLSANVFLKIKKIAKDEKAVFLRVEPPQNYKFPKKLSGKFRRAHAATHPETTLVLELSLSEDELLRQMKEKGRYNIRLAAKKGVTVKIAEGAAESLAAVDIFYKLFLETTARDRFSAHPKKYYELLIKNLSGNDAGKGFAKIFVAEFGGEPVAAIIVTFYKNTATYYFGASSSKHRNLMAPYLAQFAAIKYAKQNGFHYYDFLGIAPENAKNHKYAGITEFKKKFGGTTLNYPKAREYIFKPLLYYIIVAAKKFRAILKGRR